jgi:hypothetical protein
LVNKLINTGHMHRFDAEARDCPFSKKKNVSQEFLVPELGH